MNFVISNFSISVFKILNFLVSLFRVLSISISKFQALVYRLMTDVLLLKEKS